MSTEKSNIDGIDIAYVRRGQGAPLVLVHGYPLDHTIWDEVIPLLERDFDVIAPDLRGFGDSGILEADQSIIDYASDLAGLLDRFRLRRAFIVGHSMGGYVALAFAREFPGRVSSLGLISSQVLADTPEKKAERYATARQVQTDGVAQVADAMASKLAEDERVRSFVHRVIGVQAARALSCALQAMANRPDSLDIFRAFRFPVLIVHGQADALIPVERAREMQAALPSARYVELPGVGHMPMMEDSRAVAQAIRFFLRDQPRSVKVLDS